MLPPPRKIEQVTTGRREQLAYWNGRTEKRRKYGIHEGNQKPGRKESNPCRKLEVRGMTKRGLPLHHNKGERRKKWGGGSRECVGKGDCAVRISRGSCCLCGWVLPLRGWGQC